MYEYLHARRYAAALVVVALALVAPSVATAQSTTEHQHDAGTPAPDPHAGHDMSMMQHEHEGMAAMPTMREASGTAWLPDDTPMYARHRTAGAWMLMGHANAFVQYLHDAGDHGSHQAGSINWAMGMASRSAAGGHLSLTGMLSAEPWTIGGCGYPDLLASGERCDGGVIHDRQHPHDLFMELAASYDHALRGRTRWQIYGAPVGEPALGPVAFPHRLSAMANPLAPITHHWFDSTHVSFGVITGGVYGDKWKAEGSAFNGREPDEKRSDFDFGALDSWSGRLWFLPSRAWALQVSAGQLTEAEPGDDGLPRQDVSRLTASATYHRVHAPGSYWATTIGWGRNSESNEAATNAFFAETNLTSHDRDVWFGRLEISQKSGHDLDIGTDDVHDVMKLVGGYTRFAPAWRGWQGGIGGVLMLGVVPEALEVAYGGRANPGVGLFVTMRPSRSE
jgi:hypothetical protein